MNAREYCSREGKANNSHHGTPMLQVSEGVVGVGRSNLRSNSGSNPEFDRGVRLGPQTARTLPTARPTAEELKRGPERRPSGQGSHQAPMSVPECIVADVHPQGLSESGTASPI